MSNDLLAADKPSGTPESEYFKEHSDLEREPALLQAYAGIPQ